MPQVSSWHASPQKVPASYHVQGLAPGASPGYRVEWRDAAGKFVVAKAYASRQEANIAGKLLIAAAKMISR